MRLMVPQLSARLISCALFSRARIQARSVFLRIKRCGSENAISTSFFSLVHRRIGRANNFQWVRLGHGHG